MMASRVQPAALHLPLDARDRAGLVWLERRCRKLTVFIRRRRKKLAPGPLSREEMDALHALAQVEHGVNRILNPQHGA